MTPSERSPGATPKGIVVGTAGHVDHGKTSLVRALTGVDTDRWKEEKERGLTIDIGFARLSLGTGIEAGVVDVPGHEDFLKNMLAGATGIDLLLLVVAADEGPMPQTFEHLSIAKLLGVNRGVVALTKADRVDEDWLDLAREATRDALRRTLGHGEWPILPVSSTTGEGMVGLREALKGAAGDAKERPVDDLFRLPIDRSFSVRGTGTVVTGTVWSGEVRTGEEVLLWPLGRRARVRGLQVHGEARRAVGAGRRCAMALVGVQAQRVPRGTVAVRDEVWEECRRLGVRIEVLAGAGRPVDHERRLRVYLGTKEVMARVLLPEGGELEPGRRGWALLWLEEALVARVKDRFVLRFYSPVCTLGGGQVAQLQPGRGWRQSLAEWKRILDGSPEEALVAAVGLHGGRGVETPRMPLVTGLPSEEVAGLLGREVSGLLRVKDRWFTSRRAEEAAEFLEGELRRLHRQRRRVAAVSLGALKEVGKRRFADELVDHVLARMAEAGRVEIHGPGARLPDHRPALTDEERRQQERLLESIRAGGAEPETLSDLERTLRMERDLLQDLLLLLQEEGKIVALTPEIYLQAALAEELAARARELLARERVAAPGVFKEAFGVSRKYLIPILEYLDRRGVTRRTGEGRELAG